MIKFILRFLVFFMIAIVLFFSLYLLNILIIKNDPFLVESDIDTLLLGDSHANQAFNPDIITNSINVGQAAEPYLVSYYKLKHLLDHNPGIENVVLSFSPHNVSAFNDRKFSDSAWSKKMFDNYYPIITYKQFKELPVDKKKYFLTFMHNYIVPNFNYLDNFFRGNKKGVHKVYTYIGEFKDRRKSKLKHKNLYKVIERHYYKNGETVGISDVAIKYLFLMIDLCEEKKINVVLVSTPIHLDYIKDIPAENMNTFRSLQSSLSKNNNVYYMSLLTNKFDDGFFWNHDHINGFGADIVSEKIDNLLSRIK